MNISPKKIIALSIVTGFITGAIPASALTTIVRGSEGSGQASVQDLALDDIAILSNNPFAPVVGFFNRIPGLFISNPVRDANFKLGIAGHDAGDLRKLLDWAPDNQAALSVSLAKYEGSLTNFDLKLRSLKKTDLGEEADKTLDGMLGRLLPQVRFVDDVRETFTTPADEAALATVDSTLIGALQFIGTNLDTPEAFGKRIVAIVTGRADAATTVRTAVVLQHLVAGISGDKAADTLQVSVLDARKALVADLAKAIIAERGSASPAIAAVMKVSASESVAPTVADIVDRLGDDELRSELEVLTFSAQ